MRLNITNIQSTDIGAYHCIAKNELAITQAEFHLLENAPYMIQRPGGMGDTQEYGRPPPKVESYEDICGPPTTCPECPDPRWVFHSIEKYVTFTQLSIYVERDIKCKDAIVSLYDLVGNLEIKQTGNVSYPGLPIRTTGALSVIYELLIWGIVIIWVEWRETRTCTEQYLQTAFSMLLESPCIINTPIKSTVRGWRILHRGMMRLRRKYGQREKTTQCACMNLPTKQRIATMYPPRRIAWTSRSG